MKIGILTFWKTEDNYGQLLQCYASQKYLRSLGHETFLVRTTNGREYNPNFKQQLRDKIRTVYRLLPYPIYLTKRVIGSAFYFLTHGKLRQHKVDLGFEQFRKEYLNCTQVYTLEDLQKNPPSADAFVVGSDQIWNTNDGIYYLTWVRDGVKRIAYAASFGGGDTIPKKKTLEEWLKRFDYVSVREQSGVEICSNAGYKNAECVVDPTMLLRAEDYLEIASTDYPKEKYLFIYFLGTRTTIDWKEIHAFAKSKGLKIVYVASQGQEDKFKHAKATIHQWLTLISHAEYVLTNSFHGTVFTLLFGRKFMVYPVTGVAVKMNDRITTLLRPLGLTHHIYSDNIRAIEEDIDYAEVHSIIQKQSLRSRQLLKDWTQCKNR